MMKGLLTNDAFFNVNFGCPAINLIDEMAPINPDFNSALAELTRNWQNAIEESLRKAQSTGQIDTKLDVKKVSIFIISGYGGIRNLGKLYGRSYYSAYLSQFKSYLNTL